MSRPFDVALKEIVQPHPEQFVPVFGLPAHLPAHVLDVDLSTLSAATDVAFGFGDPLQEITDLNFQSGPDPHLDARLLLYNAAFHLHFHVPVRTLLILLRPAADHPRLTGHLAYTCGANRVEFDYEIIRMWRQPVEPYLRGGINLLPLATLCQMPGDVPLSDAIAKVVREIDQRLQSDAPHAEAVRLMTAAFLLAGMRVRREELGNVFQGVRLMHESTAYDYFVEEGLAKGLAKGLGPVDIN